MEFEHCYRALAGKDARFDGWFFTAVTSTGVYCRPSCPARTPRRENVRFMASAAAAQAAGFRACKRCRPDAAPGSPEWDLRDDTIARAMNMIADGVVDREGVGGLARRLAFSERHLTRMLSETLGAGPLGLARARRAQNARMLIETTATPFGELALSAGFSSVRQFNTTIRAVFGLTPTQLRARAATGALDARGAITVRLPFREPFAAAETFAFLAARAVPGVEEACDSSFRRSMRLPHGAGVAQLTPRSKYIETSLWLEDARDFGPAINRCRRLLDLDSDPVAVLERLEGDPLIGPTVAEAPGRRVPGTIDGSELAIRAVLGQQVSVAGGVAAAARLVALAGEPLPRPVGAVTRLFPTAQAIAQLDPAQLACRRRGRGRSSSSPPRSPPGI